MSNLKTTIHHLASTFAVTIIDALRSSSLEEVTRVAVATDGARSHSLRTSPHQLGASRLPRRSLNDIGQMTDAIVHLLEKHPEGLRVEHIRSELRCDQRELPRPLTDAVAEGRIVKSGRKRATTYFAAASSAAKRKKK